MPDMQEQRLLSAITALEASLERELQKPEAEQDPERIEDLQEGIAKNRQLLAQGRLAQEQPGVLQSFGYSIGGFLAAVLRPIIDAVVRLVQSGLRAARETIRADAIRQGRPEWDHDLQKFVDWGVIDKQGQAMLNSIIEAHPDIEGLLQIAISVMLLGSYVSNIGEIQGGRVKQALYAAYRPFLPSPEQVLRSAFVDPSRTE
ncbi:MAG: hypothetical protein GF410_01875, partial [Chitinivibrionales bacterium]|nr:hypothetical protein [Chitinivibrionales bacterium]